MSDQTNVNGLNPKDAVGVTKPSMTIVPKVPLYHMAAAFEDGSRKYGRHNWREVNVLASVYLDAAVRHLTLWEAGEEVADDSSVHHLAHAMACLAILIDAQAHGTLSDDRVKAPAVIEFIKTKTRSKT